MVQSQEAQVTASIHTTELTGFVDDDTPAALDWVTISGVLTCLDEMIPLSGKTISVWVDGIEQAQTVTTGANGAYAIQAQFQEGTYDVYTHWDGDATHFSDDSPLMVITAWKPTTSITIDADPPQGAPNFDVTISGRITRDDTGAGIQVQADLYRNNVLIDQKFANTNGDYTFTDTITSSGVFRYHTEFKGNDKYQGCEGEILPCPSCGHPVDAEVGPDVTCWFCGAASEVVPLG